jgi:hypothetical protein
MLPTSSIRITRRAHPRALPTRTNNPTAQLTRSEGILPLGHARRDGLGHRTPWRAWAKSADGPKRKPTEINAPPRTSYQSTGDPAGRYAGPDTNKEHDHDHI